MMLKAFIVASFVALAKSQCSICGEGMVVGAPDAIFLFPGQPVFPCGALETAGFNGQIPDNRRPFLAAIITDCDCGPAVVAPVGPVAPVAPVAPLAPVSPVATSVEPVGTPPVSISTAPVPAPTAPAPAPTAPAPVPTAPVPVPVAPFGGGGKGRRMMERKSGKKGGKKATKKGEKEQGGRIKGCSQAQEGRDLSV